MRMKHATCLSDQKSNNSNDDLLLCINNMSSLRITQNAFSKVYYDYSVLLIAILSDKLILYSSLFKIN